MSSSFFIGLSGLRANSFALNVIGNNLANLNTTAFKGSVVSFGDLLQTSLIRNRAGNPIQSGLGVRVAGVSANFNQGSLQTTTRATDMAIVGNGFFVVSDGQDNYFTRAGDFLLDVQGNLRTQQGLFVRGYQAVDGVVNAAGSLSNIQLPPGLDISPQATTRLSLDLNLNASAVEDDQFSSTVDVYDSLGGAHTVTYTFTKDATAGQWKYTITVPGSDVGSDEPLEISSGTLTFDEKGQLKTPAENVEDLKISGLINGAEDITFTWEVLDDAGAARLTQFATPSSTSGAVQDGYSYGTLLGFQVDADGLIQGTFSNGQIRDLAQLALANFNNPPGLVQLGHNTFRNSDSSGEPIIGLPSTGGRGTVLGNTLELSNVDVAQEFTNMILSQRGYQASSRVITTTDEVLQEAINLKR